MQYSIAIGHPIMGQGGSEARAMWLLQALKDDYDVTLVTTRTVDLDDLNSFYGTSVRPEDIKIRIAPVPFFMKKNSGIAGLRGSFYTWFTRGIGREYDLCISAYNLSDWGAPALHFIADFSWDRGLADNFHPVPKEGGKLIHRKTVLRQIYLSICRALQGRPKRKISFFDGTHKIIANSKWTASIIKKKYGYMCDDVVYPPVLAEFKNVDWEKKEFGFVSIGRISQEKRIEHQIEILEKVRALGHDVHFHIIGGIQEDPYGRMIKKKCENKPWIRLEGQKSGIEKEKLLTGHKFAIHTCPHEAFGITVAELVKAGCIPFIPNNGGQTEIVPFESLQFESVEEAVGKIDRIIGKEEQQQIHLNLLAKQKENFSVEQFCRQARKIIDGWFMGK